MRKSADRRTVSAVAGLTAAMLIAAGCSTTDTTDVASTSATSAAAVSTGASTAASTAASTSADAADSSTADSSTEASSSASSTAGSDTAAASAAPSADATAPGAVEAKGTDGAEVTLTGPIATRYSEASDTAREALGPVLMGDHNAGTRESGVVFQQFKGGVITARNADAGTPAYITWGKIRDAWNVERDAAGTPVDDGGANGSAGPLGAVTSDETTSGAVKQTTFEHGKITYNTQTNQVEVTVNGTVVPAGL